MQIFPAEVPKFEETERKRQTMSPKGFAKMMKTSKKEADISVDKTKKVKKSVLKEQEKLAKKEEKLKNKELKLKEAAANKLNLQNGNSNSIIKHTVVLTEEQQLEMLQKQQERFQKYKETQRLKLEKERLERKEGKDIKQKKVRMLAREVKEWESVREDQTCSHQEQLPLAVPVTCSVPNQSFGELLSLLEFLNTFADVIELHDVYPSGLTFEMLEHAVATKEIAGVFNDVVQLLLGSVFSLQEEEDDEITAETAGVHSRQVEITGPEAVITLKSAVAAANQDSLHSLHHYNSTLNKLPLDALTLTEVLRLHLLASGAISKASYWRLLNRGGYTSQDDPGLQFKISHPHIVDLFEKKSLFDFHIDEKLLVLQVLMQQILTYAGVRDRLEEGFDMVRKAKNALRDHQQGFNKLIKAEVAAKIAKKKEEKQKEIDKNIKKKEHLQQLLTNNQNGESTPVEKDEVEEVKETVEERLLREEKEEKVKEKRQEEHTKKEMELLDEILNLSARTNPQPLGMDRAYRRYWVFASVPGLFVEDDEQFPGACEDTPCAELVDVCPSQCPATLTSIHKQAVEDVCGKDNFEEMLKKYPEIIDVTLAQEVANTSDKENNFLSNTPNTKSIVNGGAFADLSNNVTPKVLSSTQVNSNNKLKPTNIVLNGPSKGSKLSSKNQNISKFFTKSPKIELTRLDDETEEITPESLEIKESLVEEPLVNGDVEMKEEIKSEEIVTQENISEENNIDNKLPENTQPKEIFGLCTANSENCPVHNLENKQTKWYFYYKEEDLNSLIEGLNPRGDRESDLKENLMLFKSKIENGMDSCPVFLLNPTVVSLFMKLIFLF